MPTPIPGTVTSLKLGPTTINGATNVRISDKMNLVEITALGDAARRRYPTIQEWSITFDIPAVDFSDTSHVALFNAYYDKTVGTWRVNLNQAGTVYYSGDGYIESIDTTVNADDVVKASVTIQSSGALSLTTS